jgi:glycosyltransferase involved in cell wall biosynthesis
MKVVFVGLFTPLQGTGVIARAAIEALGSAELEFTFVGTGQDLHVAKSVVGAGSEGISWRDWVPSADLPEFVAGFDVSLGIFGTTPKALRVIPNKVYQGLAAGTVVVTSDTVPQRRMKEQHGLERLYVTPPGDSGALARVLVELARSIDRLRTRGTTDSDRATAPSAIVAPLALRLRA